MSSPCDRHSALVEIELERVFSISQLESTLPLQLLLPIDALCQPAPDRLARHDGAVGAETDHLERRFFPAGEKPMLLVDALASGLRRPQPQSAHSAVVGPQR